MLEILNTSSSEDDNDEIEVIRRPKLYRNREACFAKYDDISFFERFRLTKPTVLLLLQQIIHFLAMPTNR